jgi:hypothetical protein
MRNTKIRVLVFKPVATLDLLFLDGSFSLGADPIAASVVGLLGSAAFPCQSWIAAIWEIFVRIFFFQKSISFASFQPTT